MPGRVREARMDDAGDVRAFTEETWAEQGVEDYLPGVFESWVAADDERQLTVVAEVDGAVVGCCQAKVLTDWEGWLLGMRVHPAHRRSGHGRAMVEHCFDWLRERGCVVARNLVFDWNDAGLGQSRGVGFEPATVCRWATPTPDADAAPDRPVVDASPDRAWHAWATSEAAAALGGLALDRESAWALSTLERVDLRALAGDQRIIAVEGTGADDHLVALTARVGTRDREDPESGTVTVAEYALAAWTDLDGAATLFDAIRADAATRDADAARVLLPETARHPADAAAVGAGLDDTATFVLAAPLGGD